MKVITLGEVLTKEQIDSVAVIISEAKDEIDCATKLKRYLVQFREQLESKGIHPEYLAYALPFLLEEHFRQQSRVDLN